MLISSGLGRQRLEARFQFPGQRLKSGHSSENAESQPRPVASDKALAHQLCRNEFPQRESSETSKNKQVYQEEKGYVWVDTLAGSEKGQCPCGSLNHLYGALLPGFLWPVILLCLVLSPYLVYLRVLPCVRTSLSQDGFQRRGLWVG